MATYNVTGAVAGIPLGKKTQVVEVVLDFTSTNLAVGFDILLMEYLLYNHHQIHLYIF